MRRAAVFTLFVMSAMVSSPATKAEPVVLVSNDGYTRIEGTLLESNSENYVVETSVGKITIPVADVRCEGAGCPDLSTETPAKTQAELSQDEQLELFKAFLQWRQNNEDFREFLEWRKQNAAN